ncbi:ABC-three component system protein [Mesorhizobium sp. WSM4313]|uniref:ABC-three component system protein n=1 Tax=Mesorhizobium sp. WSM4313 TaxID=2029412 RepID=UPI000BB0CA2E|nr:ABC-three component system protein [Mesorhizobium sp. WSM4313]PBB18854.1 hypothetical protein CK219_16095 [Mesorhizobium sp. WSM4313]
MTLTVANAEILLRRYEAPANQDLFFVGSADRRITFYSQQVRALELAHALDASGRLLPDDRIAVIGGGAAGLTVEMALNVLGARVELFEASAQVLNLQRGSPRLLDPKIYEWPRPGALDLRADLPFLDWSRGLATATREELIQGNVKLEALVGTQRQVQRHFGVRIASVERIANRWEVTPVGGAPQAFTKVIVTSGFGVEPNVGTAVAQAYWSADGPPQPQPANARCLISGVGDGGLTDMMALLVDNFEHRAFTEDFLNLVSAAEIATAVDAAEAAAIGTVTLQSQYDLTVRPVLEKWGVINDLAQRLVPGRTVVMNATNGSILVKGAASKLNQVMAYALQLTAAAQNPPQFSIASGKLNNVTDEAGRKLAHGPVLPDGTPIGAFDLVIVRHGPKREDHLAWLGDKFEIFKAHRSGLAAADPASADPPVLLNDTYGFFHEKQDRFVQPAQKLERAHTRERREHLIILQLDRATRSVVERGAMSLLDAITGNKAGLEIYLANAPASLGTLPSVLVRALRSAGDRIAVTCRPDDHAAWINVIPWISMRIAQLPVPYPPVLAPPPQTLSEAVDAVLLAKLDHELSMVWQSGTCNLGAVHQTILAAIQPVWDVWRTALQNSPKLRSHVLQTLWNCEGGSSWDGNGGCMARLTSALVLMLATSLAVAGLNPDGSSKQSNLAYASGFGLGSGCESRSGKQIDDCNDPSEWDADIIILSAAVELDFELAGTLGSAGGDPARSLAGAARVAPALVKRSTRWRTKLAGPLQHWHDEVALELEEFEARRDAGISAL